MTTYGADWSTHRFYKQDPLPEIEPSLLNSADIRRYVEEECLLEKDRFDPKRMKPASYEMRFLGTLYDWKVKDGRLERRHREIVEGEDVELSRNSISYLWIEEHLRLPEYIAARFNLRISDVHKGILLGTGPLIDPGFGGRILIPLHNLTDYNYPLTGGEGIIWVEFTKVSKNSYWLPSHVGVKRPPGLVAFPSHKAIDDPDAYLNKAGVAGGVQSAFRGALDNAIRAADHSQSAAGVARMEARAASNRAEEIDKRSRTFGVVGLIGVAVGIGALVLSAYDISGQVADRVHRQGERIKELETMLEGLEAHRNGSGVVEDPGVHQSPGIGVEDTVAPKENTESEADEQPAGDQGTFPESRRPPTLDVQ